MTTATKEKADKLLPTVGGKTHKVKAAPKSKAIVMPAEIVGTSMERMDPEAKKQYLQEKIAEAVRNVRHRSANVVTQKEVVAEEYDKLPASRKVAELTEQLEQAKKELQEQALNSKELQGAAEALADEKSLEKHYKAVLSMLLVQWAHTFSRRDVTVETQRLEIIISAKLGNVVDELQAELPLWDATE